MKTLHARVSPRLLQNSPLLFNQSPKGLLLELLQNCRRARATKIEIQTSEENPQKTQVRVSDNGIGIEDPDHLLHLGHTGWEETLQNTESPAGMGFFSLCHLSEGVRVHSRNWELQIPQNAFQGKVACRPLEAPPRQGTLLDFSLPLASKNIHQILTEVGEHFAVPLQLNGVDLPQKPFLKDALYRQECPGGFIGVYKHERSTPKNTPNINFYGHKVHWELTPTLWEYTTRVDAHSTDLVDLVLPARQTIVENHKVQELERLCRKAVYCFLEKSKTEHRLPLLAYQEAHALGIPIPEAKAELLPALPQPLQNHQDKYWPHTKGKLSPADGKKPQSVSSKDYLSTLSRSELAALHLSGGDFPPLYLPNHHMEGYSWYPQNRALTVHQIVQFENPTSGIPIETEIPTEEPNHPESEAVWDLNNEDEKNHPTEIFVEVALKTPTLAPEKKRYPTFLAFRGDLLNEDGVEYGWLPKKGKTEHIDPQVLETLFFSPYIDWESDSYETQTENFQEIAQEKITTCCLGRTQAVLDQLESKLNSWEVRHLLQELSSKEITLHMQENGQWKIQKPKEKDQP